MELYRSAFGDGSLVCCCYVKSAVTIWTGAVDNNLLNDANWDFSGAGGITSVATLSTGLYADDILISNAGNTPVSVPEIGGVGQIRWGTTAAFSMTFDNVTITRTTNDGYGYGDVTLQNGAKFISMFSNSTNTYVDGTCHVQIDGGSGLVTGPNFHLSDGAQLTLANIGLFTTHASQIFVNGISYADDKSILTFSGTTAKAKVAAPEPSSAALLGLGGITLTLRSRK